METNRAKRIRWELWPYAVAFGFTAVLLPVTAQVLGEDYGVHAAPALALAVAQTAPLLLAPARPLLAWCVIAPADVVGALVLLGASPDGPHRPWPWTPMVIVGYLVLCLALARRARRSTLVTVWLSTVVASLILGFVAQDRSDGTNVLLIVLSGIALLLGAVVRERSEARRQLAEQETISEAERARRTLLEERTRIARELHDVVAHHMSVITVQADSAPYRVFDLPPAAVEEFGTIAAAARESLTEMRRLLGVLRSEETQGERAPQPGLERLENLVEATIRAGVPTRLSMDEGLSEAEVPQSVQLSVYRIVQESLANVVRHAPGASAGVAVRSDGEKVTVIVVNNEARREDLPLESSGTGHGLIGMRERVRLAGGTLDAAPLAVGGFRVAAVLPLGARDEGTDAPDSPAAAGSSEAATEPLLPDGSAAPETSPSDASAPGTERAKSASGEGSSGKIRWPFRRRKKDRPARRGLRLRRLRRHRTKKQKKTAEAQGSQETPGEKGPS